MTDATKEQATYTYNIRLAENLTDYSVKEASEPTNVISKKSVVDQNNAQARVKLDINDVKYMRWQVLDKDGSVINSVSSLLAGETATNYQVVKDKYVWAKFDNWEPNNIAQESDRTVTFNLPSGKTWDDGYQVVCYWATDKSDGDFYSDGSKVYFSMSQLFLASVFSLLCLRRLQNLLRLLLTQVAMSKRQQRLEQHQMLLLLFQCLIQRNICAGM